MSCREEDQRLIDKFGDDYVAYMKRVPRINISGCVATHWVDSFCIHYGIRNATAHGFSGNGTQH